MSRISAMSFDDLTPIEIPVSIGGKKFLLREATEDAAVKYRNKLAAAGRMVDGKVVGIGDIADAEPLLVSLCLLELYEVNGPDGLPQQRERPVLLSTVRGWPAKVVKAIFDKCMETVSYTHLTLPTILRV